MIVSALDTVTAVTPLAKTIWSRVAPFALAFAAAIAARSEPAPLSLPFATVKVAADAVAGSASVISAASVAARERPCMRASSRSTGPRSNAVSAYSRGQAQGQA